MFENITIIMHHFDLAIYSIKFPISQFQLTNSIRQWFGLQAALYGRLGEALRSGTYVDFSRGSADPREL